MTDNELLNKINDKGLIVLSSFHIAYPFYAHDYDNRKTVPDDEWAQIKKMWKSWDTVEVMTIGYTITIDKLFTGSGCTKVERHIKEVYNDRENIRIEHVTIHMGNSTFSFPGGHPSLAEFPQEWEYLHDINTEVERDNVRYKKHHWQSEYLEREGIEMDEYFEEFEGLLTRYIVKDIV